MAHDQIEVELTGIFADQDKALRGDGEAFVASVNRKLTRRIWVRRLSLGGAMLVGGVVAGTNAPELVGQAGAFIRSGNASVAALMGGVSGVSERLLGLILIAAISTLAVFSSDRA